MILARLDNHTGSTLARIAVEMLDEKDIKLLGESGMVDSLFIQHCEENELEDVRACLTREVDVNMVSKNGLFQSLGFDQ